MKPIHFNSIPSSSRNCINYDQVILRMLIKCNKVKRTEKQNRIIEMVYNTKLLILKEGNRTNSEKDTQDLDFHPLLLQLQNPSQNPEIQSSEWKWDNKLCLVPWIFDIGILPMLNSQSTGFHVVNVCKMCIEMKNSKLAYCQNQNYLPQTSLFQRKWSQAWRLWKVAFFPVLWSPSPLQTLNCNLQIIPPHSRNWQLKKL